MKERFFATEAQNDRNREPTPDKVGGDEFVILSETKDLDGEKMKERFFAEDAQNDTHPAVILNEVKDLGGGRAKERFFAEEAQNDKMKERFFAKDAQNDKMKERFFATNAQNDRIAGRHGPYWVVPKSLALRRGEWACRVQGRNPAYEKMIALRCGMAHPQGNRVHFLRKEDQNDSLSIVILNEVKDLDSGKTEVRFFAKDAQNDRTKERFFAEDAQNDKMKERFFAKDAQNDRDRRTTPSLRDAPSKKGVKGGTGRARSLRKDGKNDTHPVVILNEVKDLGGGRAKERFFAKEAQNDRIAGKHGGLPLPLLLCLMLLSVLVSPVVAQEPTTRLFLNPTPLVIDTTISPTGVVTLEVADGVDIFAFDLFVQYDPSLLSVSQVALGDFLGEGLFCMDMVNEPGLVHYSCTRFGVNTGVTGSGVLLELTFEAFGQAGDTILSLANSQLFESQDAFLVDATLEDGAVSVRPYWSYLPLILSASRQGTEALL